MHDLLQRRYPPPITIDQTHAPDCQGEVSQGNCASWCYVHHQCEPLRPTDYTMCGECYHVFRTPEELIRSHMLVMQALSGSPYQEWDDRRHLPKILVLQPNVQAKEIKVCPHCTHDF